jgi:hypothetical protein
VWHSPLAGEFANLLVSGETLPAGLAVDSASVYWASYGDNAIKQAPLGGGTSQVLIDVSGAPAPPYGVAIPPAMVPVNWRKSRRFWCRLPTGGDPGASPTCIEYDA